MKYQVHPEHQGRKGLIQVVNGRAVNLLGKPVKRVVKPKSQYGVETEIEVPGATQADLKAVHEMGTKDIKGRLLVIAVDASASVTPPSPKTSTNKPGDK